MMMGALHPFLSRRAVLAGATGLAMSPVRLLAAEGIGVVEAAQGEAMAAGPPMRALMLAAPVYVGDEVITGNTGRLALLLGIQTRVLMGSATRLTIDRFLVDSGAEFTLGEGAIIFDRPEDEPRTPVAVVSPFALIAVRGTRFFAGPSRDVFGIFVERGNVQVVAAGREITLTAGQGTDITAPGMPPTDPATWGEARIREALASVIL
jgi:ferric-dicitrate binding protein FerR (iron transport regulator)